MKYNLIPGIGGVVRFPVERRANPTLGLADELAPPDDLAMSIADERAGDDEAPDVRAEAAHAFARLAEALEFGMGQEAAMAGLRAMVQLQVEQACAAGWRHRDAKAAMEEADATLKMARDLNSQEAWIRSLGEGLRAARAEWSDLALAARAATDAACGAQEALDCHERGEVWRRMTSEESARLLLDARSSPGARGGRGA